MTTIRTVIAIATLALIAGCATANMSPEERRTHQNENLMRSAASTQIYNNVRANQPKSCVVSGQWVHCF